MRRSTSFAPLTWRSIVIFSLPVFFQAIRGSSPITSGVQLLPLALTIAPAGMAAGISIGVTCVRPSPRLG